MHQWILAAASVVLCAACSNSVDLAVADRHLVSPMRVDGNVPLPERLVYVDGESQTAGLGDALVFGLTGVHVDSSSVSDDERQKIRSSLDFESQAAGRIMREEMIRALRRKKVATVVNDSSASSRLQLQISALGMESVENFGAKLQYYLEVQATLYDRNDRIIWKTWTASYPHNPELPAHEKARYLNNRTLMKSDYALTCRYVAELLAEYLRDEMSWDPDEA